MQGGEREGLTIREYGPGDSAAVRDCYRELQDYQRAIDPLQHEGEFITPRYVEYMLAQAAETAGEVFVADAGGEVVGFVSVWLRVRSRVIEEVEYEYAYVSDLVVLPRHRGRGIGRALLRTAEEFATRRGAKILRIAVLARNEGARRLYLDCGFEERIVSLSKNLPPAEAGGGRESDA